MVDHRSTGTNDLRFPHQNPSETLINSEAQTQLGKLSLLFVVLFVHAHLTENILRMGEIGHDVTAFPGSCQAGSQFTQLV